MARGHIRQRSKGSWSVVLSLGNDPETGKRRRKWVAVRGTKREAEAEMSRLLAEHDRGVSPASGKLTVREYLHGWLRDVVAVRNRPRTQEGYASIIRQYILPSIGQVQLAKLEPSHVDGMLSRVLKKGLSGNTAHHAYVVLSKALKDALRKGMIGRNVCQAVEPPQPGRYEVDAPEASTIRDILEVARETPYTSILTFMAYTGLRRGEAIALRWTNVDLDRGVASIIETIQREPGKGLSVQRTKSAAGRRGIALDPSTVAMLRQHRARQSEYVLASGGVYEDHDLVFAGPLGHPVYPDQLTHAFKAIARKTGFPDMRLHDLRHGHASGLVRAGVHPRVVQERLGHASAAFTMQVYGHVAAGLQEEAAAAFAGLVAGGSR